MRGLFTDLLVHLDYFQAMSAKKEKLGLPSKLIWPTFDYDDIAEMDPQPTFEKLRHRRKPSHDPKKQRKTPR